MGMFSKMSNGLARSRDKFKESMNVLLKRGPQLDEEFWDDLEEALILTDLGPQTSMDIIDRLRDQARRKALPDAYAVLDLLSEEMQNAFASGGEDILGAGPSIVLFVGINGTGKTTTVGKLAHEAKDAGREVILGSADTFRAAAIEQLEAWAKRAGVPMVSRERGADPASVCFETIEAAENLDKDLVLIDTAGRLHTSDDLMRELEKVVAVTKKRANMPVHTVLVIDATTGQNGLAQAREFDRALDLDALIVTKLDGSAKGGIALAISHELDLPIIKCGVGEQIDDLRDFDARSFTAALIGDFEDEDLEDDALARAFEPSAVSSDLREEGFDEASDTQTAQEPIETEQSASSQGSSEAMSWDEFVAWDDEQKASGNKKKHFWDKW